MSVAAPEQCPFLPPASGDGSGGAAEEQAKDIELAKEMSFMSTNGTTLRKYGRYQAPGALAHLMRPCPGSWVRESLSELCPLLTTCRCIITESQFGIPCPIGFFCSYETGVCGVGSVAVGSVFFDALHTLLLYAQKLQCINVDTSAFLTSSPSDIWTVNKCSRERI